MWFRMFVLGAYDGFGWANLEAKKAGTTPLFCPPEDTALTGPEVDGLLTSYLSWTKQINSDEEWSKTIAPGPVSFFLLDALRKKYPCPGALPATNQSRR